MKIRHKYYKNKYYIVFYDATDEVFVDMFNSLRDIAKYRGMEITPENIRLLNIELLNALKRPTNYTEMLNGQPMHVYLIDINSTEEF